MAVLRFLASLFALIAIVALVADATPALTRHGSLHGPLASSAIGRELAPASLVATRANVAAMTFPWVWNPVLLSVLDAPMSVLFAGLAIVCGYFGRRRVQLKVHVN